MPMLTNTYSLAVLWFLFCAYSLSFSHGNPPSIGWHIINETPFVLYTAQMQCVAVHMCSIFTSRSVVVTSHICAYALRTICDAYDGWMDGCYDDAVIEWGRFIRCSLVRCLGRLKCLFYVDYIQRYALP